MPVQIDGINIHVDNSHVDLVKRLGCSWVRIDVDWWNTERKNGVYSWGLLDSIITKYKNAGFLIYATLMGTPAWHKLSITDPPDMEIWTRFCKAFAKRYLGKVSVISLWNEPNLGKRFWSGSKDEFFETIVRSGYTAIKSVNKDILVAAPDFATTSNSDWPSWLSKMKKYRNFIDILSIHTYHDTAEEVVRCWNYGKVPLIGWIVPKWRPYKWYIKDIGKPTYLTEIGLEANYGNADEMKRQKELVSDIMKEKRELGVDFIFFYCLLDADPSMEEPFGFYSSNGKPKTVAI